LQFSSAVIASCEVAEVPEVSVTLMGLNDVATPEGAVAEKVTVPENPFTLVTFTVV
jgi:hypothetical protein